MIPALRTRHLGRELLDEAQLDPGDLRRNLREMAMLNRLPGGIAASLRAIGRLLDGTDPAVVLDVGTGPGDLPAALARRNGNGRLRIVASDLRPEVLAYAARRLGSTPGVELLLADARSLQFPDGSFDVVHASLLLHHLDPSDAVAALCEMRRVARRGVVVNDLRRSSIAFGITALVVLALTRGRYTRVDGILSARRAYTLAELDDLAASAGMRVVRRSPEFLPRVVTVYR